MKFFWVFVFNVLNLSMIPLSALSFRSRWAVSKRIKLRKTLVFSTKDDFSADGKKRVLFLGTPEVAATTLKALVEDSKKDKSLYDVVGIVTQPPKPKGRKGKLVPSPVQLMAEELGVSVLCPDKAKDKDFLDQLENEVKPDLCITAAYGQYLPKRFLATPTYGTVNIHPSLLPRWRGASPVQRSLEAGDEQVGVSVLFTVSKMDAGPIIAQKEETVDENEQATTLLPHLFEIGTSSLLDVMPDLLTGKITMETAAEQDEANVVNADMISSSEAELRVWEESAAECHNRCRGFSMWPGTFMYIEIEDLQGDPLKVKILETRLVEEKKSPTNVLSLGAGKKSGIMLVCGDGSVLEILRMQPPSKKPMDAKSFVNGYPGRSMKWVNPNANQDE